MGLNWSQGLAGAAEGLNIMAGRAARREEQEVEQMRQENLLRLRQKLDLETEGVRHKNALELSDKQYEKAEMLQKHADERAETRERGAFGRQKQLIESQDARADARSAREGETYERRARADRARDAARRAAELAKLEADAFNEYQAESQMGEPGSPILERRRRQLEALQRQREEAEDDAASFGQTGMPQPPERRWSDPASFGQRALQENTLPQLIPAQRR